LAQDPLALRTAELARRHGARKTVAERSRMLLQDQLLAPQQRGQLRT
jgi:hypothetical protein